MQNVPILSLLFILQRSILLGWIEYLNNWNLAMLHIENNSVVDILIILYHNIIYYKNKQL